VVKNVITGATDEISLGVFTVDLQIKNVQAGANGDAIIKVKRNIGDGNISGIKFIVSDGDNTDVIEKPTSMNELSEKKFTITQAEMSSVAFIKEVSVAPVLVMESGKKKVGKETSKLSLSNKEIISNLGAVSWWKLDGNAVDSIGNNNGKLMNGVDCSVSGKYGKACKFDGIDDTIINISALNLPLGSNARSIFMWIKTLSNNLNILKYGSKGCVNGGGEQIGLFITSGGVFYIATWCNDFTIVGGPLINDNQWHYVGFTIKDNTYNVIAYIDGIPYSGSLNSFIIPNTQEGSLSFSSNTWGYFNGTMDEIMIFNRSLSDKEVQGLYSINLS